MNDTLVSLKENKKELFLDLEKYNIPFSKNGILITLERLTKKEYKVLGFVNGPSFGKVGVSDKYTITPYFLNQRYENLWKTDNYLIDRNNTLNISLVVLKRDLKE